MAKSDRDEGDERRVRPRPPTRGERAADEIRSFHELGGRVVARRERDRIGLDRAARLVSGEEGVSYDGARKAHQFARKLDAAALEKLCDLCRDPRNTPPTVNHIRRVLKLRQGPERMKWLGQAARGGWSADRLDDEIQRSTGGVSGKGGPRRRVPEDLVATLEQILISSDAWLGRYDSLWSQDSCCPPIVGHGRVEPEILAGHLEEVVRRIERLKQASQALGKRLATITQAVRPGAGSGDDREASSRGKQK